MIYTQSVKAWADVGGTEEFKLKNAKVDRATGRTVGQATITGIVDSTQNLQVGVDVKVYVEATTVGGTGATPVQIFGGKAHSAKQDKEGAVTIEAYEGKEQMLEQTVKLEVGEPQYPDTVLVELMGEVYGSVSRSRSDAGPSTPYVAERSDFVGGDYASPWRFGNANRGLPLIDAVEDLSDTLGGNIWTDREGVVQITPYPNHTEWETPFITEVDAGEETRNAERVIFEGTGAASDLGQGASYINTQTSPSSASPIERDSDEEPEAPTKTLSDDNVSNQEEADERAFNESVRQDQQRDMGSITIIGNANIELFDHVVVPEVEFDYGGFQEDVENNVQAGKYKVDGLTHTIDAQDGFLTKIKLSPPIESTYDRCSVASTSGFEQKYLSSYDNSVESTEVSGEGDDSGFLDVLAGAGGPILPIG